MVGSRLGQVRFAVWLGYVTFLCDRYGSTCDANHTNTGICYLGTGIQSLNLVKKSIAN